MSQITTAETEDRKDDRVNFFISYASGDRVVAAALRGALIEIDRNRVACFLDTETIESGTDWERNLTAAPRERCSI
jgi:hypothetical protein